MKRWTQDEQRSVAKVLVSRWPGAIRNQGWRGPEAVEMLEAFLDELQHDGLTPVSAIRGLRECSSAFLPSVGQVRQAAWDSKPSPTPEQVQAAVERTRREAHEQRARELGPGTSGPG